MTLLGWGDSANLEQSLYDFLSTEISNASLKVLDNLGKEKTILVKVGNSFDDNWTLPVVQVYKDSNPSAPRLEIGSNRRDTRFLLIIDIRCENETQRINIADWVTQIINEGFPFYEYTMNGSSPTKSQNGNASFDFVLNQKINLGEDVSLFDKFRHRISISCWLSRSS